jgi:single-strand DNA-binding protein
MANQIQIVIYEGFLANDPEMRYLDSGKAVTNFRMGSNSTYKNAEGNAVKETTWLKITCWNKLAEIVHQYCAKGSQVVVTGKLRVGKNGSPEVYNLSNGEPAASYEITARDVRILKGREGTTPPAEPTTGIEEDAELPF